MQGRDVGKSRAPGPQQPLKVDLAQWLGDPQIVSYLRPLGSLSCCFLEEEIEQVQGTVEIVEILRRRIEEAAYGQPLAHKKHNGT